MRISVEVLRPDGAADSLRADTSSSPPARAPIIRRTWTSRHPRVLDSDTVLRLQHTPRSMTIYGAGVIGCEYASIMSYLDVKVNLVDTRDRLLSFLDDEITDALSYHLREQGVVIRHDETYESVEPDDDGVVLHCRSGKKLKTDVLLWANGRSGNTENLGLEAIGLAPNKRGQLEVNESYQTELPHIYAVGDVAGPPALASASYDQGRFVGAHIADGECDWSLIEEFPTGIYTVPEISSVGRTERELTAAQVPYEVAQAPFKTIARAQITGHTVGMLKILFHRETWRSSASTASASRPPRSSTSARPSCASRRRQHHPVLRRDHLQLPDHGGGLSRRGAERVEPAVLRRGLLTRTPQRDPWRTPS
jgi:NAD(P) transhydrogenase